LKRIFTFAYQDERFFHRQSWTKPVAEWIDRIHDASKPTDDDPECRCSTQPSLPLNGQRYRDAGKISLLMGYRIVDDGVEFPALGAKTPQPLDEIVGATSVLPASISRAMRSSSLTRGEPKYRFIGVPISKAGRQPAIGSPQKSQCEGRS